MAAVAARMTSGMSGNEQTDRAAPINIALPKR